MTDYRVPTLEEATKLVVGRLEATKKAKEDFEARKQFVEQVKQRFMEAAVVACPDASARIAAIGEAAVSARIYLEESYALDLEGCRVGKAKCVYSNAPSQALEERVSLVNKILSMIWRNT